MLLAEFNWVQILLPLIGSVLLSFGIFQVIVETRKNERKRVLDRLRGEMSQQKEQKTTSLLKRDHIAEEAGSILAQTVGNMSFMPKLQSLLEQANLPWAATKVLTNSIAVASLIMVALVYFGFSILATFGLACTIVVAPWIYVAARKRRRVKQLVYQLPDVFDMMSQALRAGHSLASAIQLIHEQMPDPISTEFGRVFHEQNLGIKVEDALLAMADRVDSLDVRMFVTAVLIQRTTGGDLAEILDKISTVIRGRIELFGMVQSLTSEGRLSGWVLFALPIVVFIACVKVNYEYISQLWIHPTGKIMLAAAGGMQLMGLAMIRWIVNIKV